MREIWKYQTERRLTMRPLRAMLSSLILFVVASMPVAAHALRVTATVGGGSPILVGSSTTTVDVDGVLTTTVDFSGGVSVVGFGISGAAVAEQSGSEERILFQNVSVTGPTGCSISSPCLLSLTATSDPTDFARKPPGGYPAAVLFSASVSGAAGNEISGTGDTNADIINGDPRGNRVSVPWICTGTLDCAFETIGDPNADFFGDVGFETIQLACARPPCTPSQRFTLNLKIIGTTINIPAAGTVESRTNTPEPLFTTVPPVTGTSLRLFDTKVAITRWPGVPDLSKASFAVGTRFIANGNGIDPPNEDLTATLGTYKVTIPEGSFKPIFGGKFAFKRVIDGVGLAGLLAPLGGGKWVFTLGGIGANLSGTRKPVAVGLLAGDDGGATLNTKAVFLNP